MAKNEYTSRKVASKAAKVLRNRHSSKTAKNIAASALTQARNHPERRRYPPLNCPGLSPRLRVSAVNRCCSFAVLRESSWELGAGSRC
jgi:hypothetical protein